ncbi:hypothetical protein GCM10017687_15770 [Streptomyces echinatus]
MGGGEGEGVGDGEGFGGRVGVGVRPVGGLGVGPGLAEVGGVGRVGLGAGGRVELVGVGPVLMGPVELVELEFPACRSMVRRYREGVTGVAVRRGAGMTGPGWGVTGMGGGAGPAVASSCVRFGVRALAGPGWVRLRWVRLRPASARSGVAKCCPLYECDGVDRHGVSRWPSGRSLLGQCRAGAGRKGSGPGRYRALEWAEGVLSAGVRGRLSQGRRVGSAGHG